MRHPIRISQTVRSFGATMFLALTLLSSIKLVCAQEPKRSLQQPDLVVIDTDIGDDIDDVMAVGLALACPVGLSVLYQTYNDSTTCTIVEHNNYTR
jgi:hypothetical protein